MSLDDYNVAYKYAYDHKVSFSELIRRALREYMIKYTGVLPDEDIPNRVSLVMPESEQPILTTKQAVGDMIRRGEPTSSNDDTVSNLVKKGIA